MNIGIIGSGRIGSTLGRLWAVAGHEITFASRHPESLAALVADVGPRARAGTIEQAAAFGEVVLIALPFHALPDLGKEHGSALAGKVVLETGNPYPERDGAVAEEVRASGEGTGPKVASWLRGVRLVRAFNSVWDQTLAREAHRPTARIGIPLASDDAAALTVAVALVKDAGFDPVVVGGLTESRRFDVGTAVYNTGMSGTDLRAALGLQKS